MWAPLSMESSRTKDSSGVARRFSRWPSSRRRYPAADFSPLGGGLHGGDGHHTRVRHPGVLHGADEGGQLPLDLLIDAPDAIAWHKLLLIL